MSEQVGEAVNPGQAIYDALSDEAKAAVDALADDLFHNHDGISAAHHMVDAIEVAHAESPFGWSLQFRNTSPSNLGVQVFGRWYIARIPDALLVAAISNEDLLSRILRQIGHEGPALEEFLETRTPIVLPDDVEIDEHLKAELFKRNSENLRDASSAGWRRDISANSHRDDWRVKLALITERDVPAPGYVSARQLGLSQESVDAPSWLRERLTIDALPLLADAIAIAAGVHAGSWALTGGKSRGTAVRLDVQGTAVLEFHNRWVRLVLPKEWWEQHKGEVPGEYLHDLKSPSNAVRINVDPSPDQVAFQRFTEPLGVVVRELAAMTRTQTQRAAEHRPQLVRELAEFLNEEIHGPVYSVTNPGRAIYDALNAEAKTAVDALPEDLFVDDQGVDHAAAFSRSVSVANEYGPRSWSIFRDGGFIALNVGRSNLLTLHKHLLTVVDSTLIEAKVAQGLDSRRTWESSDGSLVQFRVDETLPSEAKEALERAHFKTVEQHARPDWKKTDRSKHYDDVRVKIAMLTGEALPAPAYLPQAEYGLPFGFLLGTGTLRMSVESLSEYFAARGLTYTNNQIAAFYTALQTKGFVILSGISGTGKSKIAQRFAQLLPATSIATGLIDAVQDIPVTEGRPFHRIKIREYMGKFHRFHIPVGLTSGLPLPEPGIAFNVPLRINGIESEARIRVRTSSGAYLFPKGMSRTEFANITRSREAFYLRFNLSESGDLIESVEITEELPTQIKGFRVRLTAGAIKYRLIGFPWKQAQKFPFAELAPSVKLPVHLPGVTVDGRLENPNGGSGGNGIQLDLPQLSKDFFDLLRAGDELEVTPIVRAGEVAELQIDRVQTANDLAQTGLSNDLFLPVRPDWRDGKALIGYHNPLSGEYVRTPFLDFVIAAADDYTAGNRNAFFVILDEMNLAHVEYYFADVLSVIESGRDSDGWTVEGIPLAVGEEDADLPETLKLPPNLYIVGTVNMDETTHPFSPKVLDRAFTIELTEVDFADYPASAPVDAALGDDEKQALLDAFTNRGTRYPRIDKGEIEAFVSANSRFRDDLQSLNMSLRRHRMHFGYRVFDEIMQFARNAELNGMFSSVADAFDHAVLMKVLPKFNGSRGKLHGALMDLIIWTRQDVLPTEEDRRDIEAKFDGYLQGNTKKGFDALVKDSEDWRYRATGARAALMMQDLYTDGFASFG